MIFVCAECYLNQQFFSAWESQLSPLRREDTITWPGSKEGTGHFRQKEECLKKYGALRKWRVVSFHSSTRYLRVAGGLEVGQVTRNQITKDLYLSGGIGSRALNRRVM